jgi:hypothetical protein
MAQQGPAQIDGEAAGRLFAEAVMTRGDLGPVDMHVIAMGLTDAERRQYLIALVGGIAGFLTDMASMS